MRDVLCTIKLAGVSFLICILQILCLSISEGETAWTSKGPYGGDIKCLAMGPKPGVLYAGATTGVFKSIDGGDTWAWTNLRGVPVHSIAVAPSNHCHSIRFDDLDAPCDFDATSALTEEYSAFGVVFSGPGGKDGGGILDECSSFSPLGQSSPNFLAFDTRETLIDGGIPRGPETITFASPVSYVRVNAAWSSVATMNAYDDKGNLLDSDTVIPYGWFKCMEVSGVDIKKAVISFDPSPTLLLDDLAYVPLQQGQEADVIYAGTDDGLYKSNDGGDTWAHSGLLGARVNAIAINPRHPCIIYAGTGKSSGEDDIVGVFKSTDGGEGKWENTLSTTVDSVLAILLDSDDPTRVYVGVHHFFKGFWVSPDEGETWEGSEVGPLSPNEVSFLTMTHSGMSPSMILAIADRKVYKSMDRGDTWIEVSAPSNPLALASDPNNANVIYSGNRYYQGRFYKSLNGGDTWSVKEEGLPSACRPSSIVVDPWNGHIFIGLYEGGVYKSTDGADTWDFSSEGMTGRVRINDLAIHPEISKTVLAAVQGDGYVLAKTENGGSSWQYMPRSPSNQGAVAISSDNPSIIWTGDGLHIDSNLFVHQSNDSGVTWDGSMFFYFISGSDHLGVTDILIQSSNPDSILVGTVHGYNLVKGVMARTIDKGVSWSELGLTTTSLAADPNLEGVFYRGKGKIGQIYRYIDVWGSWGVSEITPLEGIGDVRDIEVDSDSGVYVSTNEGMWRWKNDEWIKLDGPGIEDVTALAIDRSTRPDILFVGTEEEGIFVSYNEGITWTPYNEGLEILSITRLALSETEPFMLYAGTTDGGVWSTALSSGCPSDFDLDGDVDAFDLFTFASQFQSGDLGTFSSEFGRNDCLE